MLLATPIARILALLAGIHGTVRPAGQTDPAAGIRVELDGVDRAITDSAGHYAVGGLAAGPHRLRFVSRTFETRDVVVLLADSTDLTLDVELTVRAAQLPPLTVVAPAFDEFARRDPPVADWREAGHFRYDAGWQSSQPAGGVDILAALARTPGVATRGDNTTALSVHGGRGSESLTLLDGIPLFGAVHFASAASAVNPDAIQSMDLHAGVTSARFGDALSGVVELETGETLGPTQVTGALSAADVRSMVRTTIGPSTGVLLGARSSFRDLMTDGTGLGTTNGYQDFLAVGRTGIGSGLLRVVGFASTNHLRWEPALGGVGHATDGTVSVPAPMESDAASWATTAIGATWVQPLRHGGEWDAAAWWSGNTAAITTLTTDQTLRLGSGIGEFGLSSSWRQFSHASMVLFGGELMRPHTWYRTATTFAPVGVSLPGVDLAVAPIIGAVYGEWDWHGSSRVDLRAGLRASTDFTRSISVDPRLVVNLHPDRDTRIGAGFGRTHQFVQSMLNEDNLMSGVVGPALLTSTSTGLNPASSDQWVLSVEHRIAAGVTVALDGYIRNWQNVLAPAATSTGFFVAANPVFGDGRARGVNASMSIVSGRVAARASAGMASSVQTANGSSYSSSFEQPWNFSGDVNYQMPARTTLQLQWTTGAGQPATAVLPGIEWQAYQPATGIGEIEGSPSNVPGAVNALRLAGPVRIDLGLRRDWRLGTSSHASALTTAVRLQNVLNRSNPIGILAGSDGGLQFLNGTSRGLVFEVGWNH